MSTPSSDTPLSNPIQQEDIELGEPELFEHHRIQVDKGQEMMRLDKYLQMRLEGISRTKIQAAAHAGCVLVNNKAAKSNYKIKPCDIISVLLPQPPHEIELIPEPVPFKAVYEDDDVLVIDKQAGLVVHPGHGNINGTLLLHQSLYAGPMHRHRISSKSACDHIQHHGTALTATRQPTKHGNPPYRNPTPAARTLYCTHWHIARHQSHHPLTAIACPSNHMRRKLTLYHYPKHTCPTSTSKPTAAK